MSTEELLAQTAQLYRDTSAALKTALEQNTKLNEALAAERLERDGAVAEISELKAEVLLLQDELAEALKRKHFPEKAY